MITLTATINLLSGSGNISSATIDGVHNNISSSINDIIGTTGLGSKPFILASSPLGEAFEFSSNVNYFISRQLSDSNGNFATPFNIVISGTGITNLTIVFDTKNNNYPKSIKIGENTYSDDDSTYVIPNLTGDTHTITISNWSKPNTPLVIQGIYTNISINLDNRSLIEITRGISDRADYKLPSYGVISNSGTIKFNDLTKEIQDYAKEGLLKEKQDVKIYINNTLNNKQKTLATYKTGKWDYDNNNFVVSVSLKDDLEEWQDINLKGFDFDIKNGKAESSRVIFDYLYNNTPARYKMTKYEDLDSYTQERISLATVAYPMLKRCTLWQGWQKFCQLVCLHIYKNEDGVTMCVYTGGL